MPQGPVRSGVEGGWKGLSEWTQAPFGSVRSRTTNGVGPGCSGTTGKACGDVYGGRQYVARRVECVRRQFDRRRRDMTLKLPWRAEVAIQESGITDILLVLSYRGLRGADGLTAGFLSPVQQIVQ